MIPELVKKSRIPIVTSVNKFLKNSSDAQKEMLELDILATDIYSLGYQIPDFRKTNLDYIPLHFINPQSLTQSKIKDP